eukprot:CAMPEP_0170617202 /NCGR_PEP_ID=MMETSP0224-20130122/26287_1 /TAXON_ID=285029 /ORGANISM="Togula jolla, Strain CCCM 725" /LENGTH=121 /DNA_ID=CAMNT_0010943069 /DNA_START=18 /DNA_END=383 /DNA_ORIENTATION=+
MTRGPASNRCRTPRAGHLRGKLTPNWDCASPCRIYFRESARAAEPLATSAFSQQAFPMDLAVRQSSASPSSTINLMGVGWLRGYRILLDPTPSWLRHIRVKLIPFRDAAWRRNIARVPRVA